MIWSVKSFRSIDSLIYDSIAARTVTELSLPKTVEVVSSLKSGASVLDVGCGGGQLVIELAKLRPDLVLSGLDLSSAQIKRARKRAYSTGVQTEFFQGSALDLPFQSDAFDLVYSVASIKHWPDFEAGLKECLRLVKPGGLLIIAEVDKNCRKEAAAAFIARCRLSGFMKSLSLVLFRIFVCNRSIALNDANRLFASLPVKKYNAGVYAEGLFWIVVAQN